jgi:RNA polymerase sigma-70 factor, ECF subfamily
MRQPSEQTSSEELARGAQQGSPACFGELVARHQGALLRFLRLRTRSDEEAEELAQEAFLRAWRKLATYRDEWKFSTWLFAVARRVAASRYRTATHQAERGALRDEAALTEIGVEADPGAGLGEREEHQRVWGLAARVLNADQRMALWLRYGEDLAIEEIGRVLGRRPVAVRALLFRARETLAPHLGPVQAEGVGTSARAGRAGRAAASPVVLDGLPSGSNPATRR